jgi:putative tributyrin esterase
MRSLGFLLLLVLPWTLFSQDQQVFFSASLNQPDTVWIFTPENYKESPEQKFPVVYLLHGWSGYYSYWDQIIDCQFYSNKYDMIIVCPDGLYDSWYLNSPVKGENEYEDFFIRQLMPYISNNYRVNPDAVFITGLSMGGHGALYLFACNPSLFASAGSLSGLLDLHDWRKHYGISRILGLDGTKDDDLKLQEFSVTGNLDQLAKANKKLIVSCGTEDPFYDINVRFKELGDKKGVKIKFIESPGSHNSEYWSKAVNDHFDSFQSLLIP